MKNLNLAPGDKVEIKTKSKIWTGNALQSHDSEIILLKLESGYNIGIRESDILNAKILEKFNKKSEDKKNQKTEGNCVLSNKRNEVSPNKGEVGGAPISDKSSKKRESKKNIALIITGGTISSRLDPKTGGVISTDAEEILNIAPEINEIANIVKLDSPFMKFSENMHFQDWKVLAEKTADLLNDENIDGVVISHGTDFLHYTSAALSFYLGKLNKPVALTYSQRSIDRGSTDAHLNLICAAKYAISDIAEVALVGHEDLNDNSCLAMPGTKVRKMHTSRRDTFKIINSEPLAKISPKQNKEIEILKSFNSRNDQKIKADTRFTDKVALIKIHPGQDPSIIEFYQNQGYKGLVLELTGIGQAPTQDAKYNWLPKIKKAIESGMTILGAPQTIYGKLNLNVYSAGRDLQKTGLISMQDMLPETALVKLSWVLGHRTWTKNKETIKEKLLENFSGEFNEELGFDDF